MTRSIALTLALSAAIPLTSPMLFAQTTAPTTPDTPNFAVSVVKPSAPDAARSIQFSPGGRFTARSVTVRLLIKIAYDLNDDELTGGPSWIGLQRFDIDATPDTPDNGVNQSHNHQRLQALLADRFHLDLRSEMKMMSTYALVVAKSGPKLKKSQAPDDAPAQFHANAGEVMLTNATLDQFANAVSDWVREPVLNQTAIDGKYDLRLDWTPDPPPSSPDSTGSPTSPPANSGPTIFTALQQQLGLSLQARKNQALCKVVDHVQLPSPD